MKILCVWLSLLWDICIIGMNVRVKIQAWRTRPACLSLYFSNSKGPYLHSSIAASRYKIPIHVTESFNRFGVTIGIQGWVLHAGTVVNLGKCVNTTAEKTDAAMVYLNAIFTRRCHNFTCVKLQRGNGMVVFECLKNPSCTQVPYL